jgi:hypothetical protein
MTSGTVTVSKFLRIPTLAEGQCRRSELLAQQAAQLQAAEPEQHPTELLEKEPDSFDPLVRDRCRRTRAGVTYRAYRAYRALFPPASDSNSPSIREQQQAIKGAR